MAPDDANRSHFSVVHGLGGCNVRFAIGISLLCLLMDLVEFFYTTHYTHNNALNRKMKPFADDFCMHRTGMDRWHARYMAGALLFQFCYYALTAMSIVVYRLCDLKSEYDPAFNGYYSTHTSTTTP